MQRLYFKGRDEPLTSKYGKLKTFSKLKSIPDKNRLCDLGFEVPMGKVTPQHAVMLNRVEEEMPSMSDIAKADEIELQKIMKNVARSMENLIAQLEGESSEDLKKVELEERIKKEKCKLEEIRDNPEYDDGIQEDIRKRITKLNDNLPVRQESIDLCNGRLKDQITSFKEIIAKVLDKNTSLAEKIWMLFQEQRITIA